MKKMISIGLSLMLMANISMAGQRLPASTDTSEERTWTFNLSKRFADMKEEINGKLQEKQNQFLESLAVIDTSKETLKDLNALAQTILKNIKEGIINKENFSNFISTHKMSIGSVLSKLNKEELRSLLLVVNKSLQDVVGYLRSLSASDIQGIPGEIFMALLYSPVFMPFLLISVLVIAAAPVAYAFDKLGLDFETFGNLSMESIKLYTKYLDLKVSLAAKGDGFEKAAAVNNFLDDLNTFLKHLNKALQVPSNESAPQ